MKQIISFLIIILLTFITCKEKEPTSPEDETPKSEILAEAALGTEGGVLETEEFKLTVPPGSFSSSSKINLLVESEENPFGGVGVSKLFKLEGIPRNFQNTLEVSLKYTGTLSGLNFIAVGVMDTIKLMDSTFIEIVYDLIEAEESEGTIIGQISNNLNIEQFLSKNNIDDEIIDFFIGGLTKGEKWNPFGDHFEVKGVIPENQRSNADEIISCFEQAYQRFESAGFFYSGVKWPMKIDFINEATNFDSNPLTYISPKAPGKIIVKYNEIINVTALTRELIQSAFLDNILKTYNLRSDFSHQVIVWAGMKYSYGLWPKKFINDAINGWTNNFQTWYQCLLFEYLTNLYGELFMPLYCVDIKFSEDHIWTVVKNLGEPHKWLSGFYQYLMLNDNFTSNLSDDYWINKSHKIYVDNEFEKLEISKSYPDLSARWFHVTLSKDIVINTDLKFSTDNELADISVIKYLGKDFELVDNALGQLTISNIQNLVYDGYDLYVIVTNNSYKSPYKNNTDIYLTIEKSKYPEVIYCDIEVKNIEANIDIYYPDNTVSTTSYEYFHFHSNDDFTSSFQNNEFYQSYQTTTISGPYEQDITVKFNGDFTKILSFTVNAKSEGVDLSPSSTTKLSGHDIPLESDLYVVTGEESCDKLSTVEYSRSGGATSEYKIININKCVPQTRIKIEIKTK